MFAVNRIAKAAGVALVALPTLLAAQGWIEPVRPVPTGRIEKLRSAVQVVVSGRVARVTVEEWFRNTGPILGEGTYLYPLPGEAVFSDYSLWQGDQELRGEMMDATQARSIYEAIVRQKRDPALIELAGHGMIRARVFPIAPGETRKITLRYIQVLDRLGDAWRFRYASGRDATPRSFRMQVDSAGRIGDPYSPTHRVTAVRQGDQIDVTLADASWSGDLEVLLPLTRGLVGMSLITHRPAGERDGFFMLLLAPGHVTETTLRRDLVAVVDVSGSMSGEKLDQAKAALVQLVGTLHSGDRFRLVAFSSTVRSHSSGWREATPENVRDAQDWVRSLAAAGSTNIAGALTEAFAAAPAEGALGVVVFLTDGLPTVSETNPERIADAADRARGLFRVFSFGIGDDVNTYLLDRLTERARGATEYVGQGGSIEAAVGSLTTKIATPVLTDLALSGDGVELYDLQPGNLPDLFAGDEMVVLGRYRSAEGGSWGMSVTGRRASRQQRFTTRSTADAPAGTDYVAHLWAARKAGALGREIRLHGQTPEVVKELRDLALRYGILTEYTAYLVQEPGVVATRPLERSAAPAPAQQFGAPSVAKARRDAQAASTAVAAEAAELDQATRGGMGAARTEQVGGRVFVWRDSVWTDLRHGDSLPVVTVEAFSDAYFALVRALPEIVKSVALEPTVVVAGRRVSIKIGAQGRTEWRAGELEALVREFRT